MKKFKISKVKNQSAKTVDDLLIEEIPFTINLNEKELATFLCTPIDLEDLTRGFLFTSGLISNNEEIIRLNLDLRRWTVYIELSKKDIKEELVFKRLYTSGCGRGTLFYSAHDMLKSEKIRSDLTIKSSAIYDLMQAFQKKSLLYKKTGGNHSAAVTNETDMLVFREDIGRHNAIDKVIGFSLKENIDLGDKMLITSGRISSEVLLKAQKCKFPLVISKAAPTNQAVKLARDMHITLAGFVRGQSMNIYSNPERIQLKK